MKRVCVTCGIIFAIGLIVAAVVDTNVYVGSGRFNIELIVTSQQGPIREVTYSAFGNENDAKDAVATLQLERPPELFFGKPIVVGVQSSEKGTMSGRIISRYYEKYLVVIVRLQNGRRLARMIEIPDREGAKVEIDFS